MNTILTVEAVLKQAQAELATSSESPRLDTEVLLSYLLQISRANIYANPNRELTDTQATRYAELIKLRGTGKPIAYLTGEREFWSLPLSITPDVLVPRPETELLVEEALKHIPVAAACSIVDLGCGSGAIAIAIATERPACQIVATDRSPEALQIAREDAERHCANRIDFREGSWYQPLQSGRYDLIVSNPPYVATGQPEPTDPELAHEPASALYSGPDGLDDIRLIIDGAVAHLKPGGAILLEHGFSQADTITALFEQQGFDHIRMHRDLAGRPRITEGFYGA